MSPPSSGSKNRPSKKPALKQYVASRASGRHVPPKCWFYLSMDYMALYIPEDFSLFNNKTLVKFNKTKVAQQYSTLQLLS
jgi:hypothetical protein